MVGYQENGWRLTEAVEMAALVVPLVISFGAPFSIALGRKPSAGDDHSSFAAGLYAGHVVMNSGGDSACVQLDFTPLGAYRFFGLPMRELSGSMVSLDDLADNEVAELRYKLEDTEDWNARLDLAEAFALDRLRRGPEAQPRGGLGLSRTRLLSRQRAHRGDRSATRLEPQAYVAAFPGRDRAVAEIAGPRAALQPGARSCRVRPSPTGPTSPPNAAMPTRRT